MIFPRYLKRLQWGHPLKGMEIRDFFAGIRRTVASMGPSPERDGNLPALQSVIWHLGLQWGHPLKGMEMEAR